MPYKKIFSSSLLAKLFRYQFVILVILASVCVFVPFLPSMPSAGLDPSWNVGMNQALGQGLIFGQEMIFTFGPYASIYTKNYHPATDSLMLWGSLYLAILFGIATYLNFNSSSWLVKLLLIGSLSGVMYTRDPLFFYYPLMVGVHVYYSVTNKPNYYRDSTLRVLLLIVLLTPLGMMPLVKGSMLLLDAVIVLLIIVFLAKRGYRLAPALVAITPLVSLVIFWLFAGQPLNGLIDYFQSMMPIISGYTEAMSSDGNWREILIYIIGSLCLLIIVFLDRKERVEEKAILLLILSITLFMSFKGGFVRHDGHAMMAGTTILLVGLLVTTMTNLERAPFVITLSFLVWAYIDANHMSTSTQSYLNSVKKTYVSAISGIKQRVFHKDRLVDDFNKAFANLKAQANFPILSGTTDIYSYDQSYLIASGNTWSPRPVLQSYSAYTPILIEKNKAHLEGSNAPDNLIFNVEPIDNRLPSLEDGESWPVIYSNYYPTAIKSGYVFLRKNATQTKVTESFVSEGVYGLGDSVSIPASNQPIMVKLKIERSSLGKLVNILFKPSQLNITLTMQNGITRQYRLVSSMASTGFLVSPLIENSNEFSMLFSGSEYLDGKTVKSISVDVARGRLLWDKHYSVEFTRLNLPINPQFLELLNLERPFKIDSSPKVVNSDSCDGNIDYVNISPKNSKRQLLTTNGWMVTKVNQVETPQPVSLVLVSDNQQNFYIKTNQVVRLDVASHFNSSKLSSAGYSVSADVSAIHGAYSLGLAYYADGAFHLCQNLQIPVKFRE